MKTVAEVLNALKAYGTEQTRKTFARYGADVNKMYGVKVGDMKKIAKKIKGNQQLAIQLFASGNLDAQYLAGLVADGRRMTRKELESWVKQAGWQMVAEYTVPWVACEHPDGRDLALKWMGSKNESIASSGWATYAAIVSVKPDAELDKDEIAALLERVTKSIPSAANRVRYVMNNFVISVGVFVKSLSAKAKAAAKKIGKVEVEMGSTSCQVPDAVAYIKKCEAMGRIGKKRKSARC